MCSRRTKVNYAGQIIGGQNRIQVKKAISTFPEGSFTVDFD